MPVSARPPAHCSKMETKRSAWTPLNNPLANSKVFEERRSLLAKWFARWSDSQRKAVLQDFVLGCSVEQLRFVSVTVGRQLPLQAADFACLLPRALCLYIFSFLDPRSLSRCAQVSWHWRSIVELDQLWMRKCLRIGWCLDVPPAPFQQGVWKRHYIRRVLELQSKVHVLTFSSPDVAASGSSGRQEAPGVALGSGEGRPGPVAPPHDNQRGTGSGKGRGPQPAAPLPWRDSDKRPRDTMRFNYLDNLDPAGTWAPPSVCRVRASRAAAAAAAAATDGGPRTVSEGNYKLRKAKSLMFLSPSCRAQHPTRPHPQPATRAHNFPIAMETAENQLRPAQWDAGARPRPVRAPVPRLSAEALRASRRTHRSAPSAPLFDAHPWTASFTAARVNHSTTKWTETELQHPA